MKRVCVATKNPVKINAVKGAFTRMFSSEKFEFTGKGAPSGVSDQPMSDEETFQGAKNRTEFIKADQPNFDYWVGVEGGIEATEEEMNAFAWIVIFTIDQASKAKSGTFYLPNKIKNLVISGMELGEADDIVFGENNSKQKSGAVGLLTGDLIDRKKLYEEAVILALIPFRNTKLYTSH